MISVVEPLTFLLDGFQQFGQHGRRRFWKGELLGQVQQTGTCSREMICRLYYQHTAFAAPAGECKATFCSVQCASTVFSLFILTTLTIKPRISTASCIQLSTLLTKYNLALNGDGGGLEPEFFPTDF